ncbi:MAG TPA: hypothetical protein VFE78_10395 [Gemmataceae bacterium]|nr:hypothetical protein [Gemmataceae bacterium]
MPQLTPVLLALALLAPPAAARAEDAPRAVIERAVRKMGEAVLERKTAVRATVKGKMFLSGADQSFPMLCESLNDRGRRNRVTYRVELGGNKVEAVVVFDGDHSWHGVNGRAQDFGPDERKAVGVSSYVDRVTNLVPLLKDKTFSLAPLGEDKVEGKPAVGVKVSSKDRPDVSLYFDKASGLLVKYAYRSRGMGESKEALHETILGDYRLSDYSAAEERTLKAAKVATDGPALLDYLRRRTPDPSRVAKVRELVRQLGDNAFEKREEASKGLVAAGVIALPWLREAAKGDDREVVRRANDCLKQIGRGSDLAVPAAAVRLIALRKPAGAVKVLLDYLPAADESVAQDVGAALVALGQRDGKADPELLKALEDKSPKRQAVARGVLGKDGGAWLKRPGRRLYFAGSPTAMRFVSLTDGKKQMELEVVEIQHFNAFEDREFAKPQPDGAPSP